MPGAILITFQTRCHLPDTELVNGRARTQTRQSGSGVPCIFLQPLLTWSCLLPQQVCCHPAASHSTSPHSHSCHAASLLWVFAQCCPWPPLWRTNAQPWGPLAHSHLASGLAWTAQRQGSLCDLSPPPQLESGPLAHVPKSTLYFSHLSLSTYLPKV